MTLDRKVLSETVRSSAGRSGKHYVGLAVGVIDGGETVVHITGKANDGAPTGDTLFQIGSITKVFTALALADAVTKGELSLDTPLAALMPCPPRAVASITLRDLATHTSGLPRLPKGLIRQALRHRDDPYREFSNSDLLAALASARLRPGGHSKFRYSNFGMGLLGEALSRHAGMPYDQLIAERVTQPLGLSDTVVHVRADQDERKAAGHSRRRRPVPDWDLGAMPGAGALYSTVQDLMGLLRAHIDPGRSSLSRAISLVQQPQVTVSRRLRVCLGWMSSAVKDVNQPVLWHNGGTGGFFSFVAVLPDSEIGVVVLTNTGRPVDPLGFSLLREVARARTNS